MKKTIVGIALALGLGGAALATGGLTWLDTLGLRGPEFVLRDRIEHYWEARVDGDMAKMSQFVHPMQGSISEPGMLVTKDFELKDLEVDGDSATAKLVVHSRLRHPILSARDRTVELDHNWVRYEGEWYVDATPIGIHEAIKQYKGEWKHPAERAKEVNENTSNSDD